MKRVALLGMFLVCLLLSFAAGAFAQSNSAAFVRTDSTTEGNWSSKYGSDGYALPQPVQSLPANVTSFAVESAAYWAWATTTTDPRALQTPGGGPSQATTWYSGQTFTVDITVASGQAEQIALYAIDWDSQGRSEIFNVVDGDTNAPLNSQTVSSFTNGVYLIWNISGHIKINISPKSGPNAVLSGVFFENASTNTIRVPQDQPTIQAAINAATTGQTVLVSPGTYHENIDFLGKAITVTSAAGPATTIIDGGKLRAVAEFISNENTASVLNGFTLQNGYTPFSQGYMGGGVYISGASPTITNNKIVNNSGCEAIGIAVQSGSPLIQGNIIDHNTITDCSGGDGAGISLVGPSTAQILNNTITNNSNPGGWGGGIWLNGAGTPTIRGNLISGNSVSGVTPAAEGAGIGMVNDSDPLIIENIIIGNNADSGAGVSVSVPSGGKGPTLINNTIANNTARQSTGSGILLGGFDWQSVLINNIVMAPLGQEAVTCDTTYNAASPYFAYNNAYSGGQPAWSATCDFTSHPGNLSTDPLFVNTTASNFHLLPASPAKDSGLNSAPNLPSTDFDGNNRIFNATVDLGAYEYSGLTSYTLSPPSITFPNQLVGTTSQPVTVTLTNTGAVALEPTVITSNSVDFPETDNCASSTGLLAGQSCQITVRFKPANPVQEASSITASANVPGYAISIPVSGSGIGSQPGSTASLVGTDTTSLGNWQSNYGADGYSIANVAQSLPSYASFSAAQNLTWTWATNTTDPRALRLPSGAAGPAATWYTPTSLFFDLNLTDGSTHQVALYALDWDMQGRSETISISDAASSTVLASSTVSSFSNGTYVVFNISGHVHISVTFSAGPNPVISGIFFGAQQSSPPPPAPSLSITKSHSGHVTQSQQGLAYTVTVSNAAKSGPTTSTVTVTESLPSGLSLVSMSGNGWSCNTNTTNCQRSDALSPGSSYSAITVTVNVAANASSPQVNQVTVSGGGSVSAIASDPTVITSVNGDGNSASFVARDPATQGAWQNAYGSEGYVLANSVQNLPTYDPAFAVLSQSNWTWAATSSDPRALQVPNSQANIAAAWYSSQSFSFDVNFNDGQSHDVALYAIDWDARGRSESIQILDAATNTQLDLETVSNFNNGVYLVWKITGHVSIVVTSNAGPNAVISGVFFGVPSANQWAWMAGSASLNQNGIYGTLGVTAAANAPGARQFPVTWTDTSGNLWMFGGYGYDSVGTLSVLNDLWEYSGGQWTWFGGSNLAQQNGVYGSRGQASATNIPGARNEAMSWTDSSGTLWIFGGNGFDSAGHERSLSDLWKYSAGQWTWVAGPSFGAQFGVYGVQGQPSAANNPGARDSGLSWTDAAGNLWLFGGLGFDSVGTEGELNDLWEYSAGQWTWIAGSKFANQSSTYGTQGIAASSNFPGARFGATGWKDKAGNFWLYGGVGYNANSFSGVLGDLWEYSGGEWIWMGGSQSYDVVGTYGTQGVSSANNVPSARQYASGWVDASGNFWLFGGNGPGSNGAFGQLNDLWKYSAGQWTWMSGTSIGNQSGVYGTLGIPAKGNTPSGRFFLASWTDAKGSLWLFGGYGAGSSGLGDLSDLWRYQP